MTKTNEETVIWIRSVVAYSDDRFENEVKSAKVAGTYATSATQIIERVQDGYTGLFVIVQPDLDSATGLNDGIIEAVEEAGYIVKLH